MSSIKSILVCTIIVAVCYAANSSAIELIELSDANQAILKLELSKAVKGVQEAYQNEFKFDTVTGVEKFLWQCAYVKMEMEKSNDADFEGMASKIKEIMTEPSIVSACSVSASKIRRRGEKLDHGFGGEDSSYLWKSKFDDLVALHRWVSKDAGRHLVLGHLLDKHTQTMAELLLQNAAGDVEIMFDDKIEPKGMFNFNYSNYRKGCNINLIKPICQLVRSTSHDDIDALGRDLAEFAKIVQEDKSKLAQHEQESGVKYETLVQNCATILRKFKPIERIMNYQSADFISEQQLSNQLKSDKGLDFYFELNNLCKLALPVSQS